MRVLAVAAIITSLAVPAFAAEDPAKAEANKAEEQKKRENEELDRAYKETLKRTRREQPGQSERMTLGEIPASFSLRPRLSAWPAHTD
jgi:hypothetical protein